MFRENQGSGMLLKLGQLVPPEVEAPHSTNL